MNSTVQAFTLALAWWRELSIGALTMIGAAFAVPVGLLMHLLCRDVWLGERDWRARMGQMAVCLTLACVLALAVSWAFAGMALAAMLVGMFWSPKGERSP